MTDQKRTGLATKIKIHKNLSLTETSKMANNNRSQTTEDEVKCSSQPQKQKFVLFEGNNKYEH